ncbi:hypothetical protein [Azospirillum sp. sgz301742]
MKAHALCGGFALAVILGIAVPAYAQGWHEHRGEHRGDERRIEEHRREEHFRDRDIARFREHDLDRWRGGRWYHGHHDGRRGWWWIVGGVWYFYPVPVYPYPDPYLPPVAPPPPQPSYYYCPSPPGYYPYVPECPTGWRAVPAR